MPQFETEQPLVPAPILAAPEPPATNILIGPLGLRAGWGILLFLVLSGLLAAGLFFGVAKGTGRFDAIRASQKQGEQRAADMKAGRIAQAAQPMRLSLMTIPEATQTGGVLLAALCVSLVERRRFRVYGLPRRLIRDLLPGALWGLVAMAILVGALRALHLLSFDRQLLHGGSIARFGSAWLLFFLLVGLFEEFLFRGYIQFTLMRGLLGLARRIAPSHERLCAFWISAVFWSVLFFVVHISNSGETPAGLLGVFLAGILFSYALWRTGSLWWGIGFHMTWDWSQSFLYGVPDSGTLSVGRLFQTHALGNPLLSGGVDGPEGSLLILPVLLLAFLAIRLHRQQVQPPVEPETRLPHTPVGIPGPLA